MGRGKRTLTEIFEMASRGVDVTPRMLQLWLLYRKYDHAGKGSYPGIKRLAAEMNCTQRQVKQVRAQLMEKGFLRKEREGAGRRPAVWLTCVPGMPEPVKKPGPEQSPAHPNLRRRSKSYEYGSPAQIDENNRKAARRSKMPADGDRSTEPAVEQWKRDNPDKLAELEREALEAAEQLNKGKMYGAEVLKAIARGTVTRRILAEIGE